jgi:single-stranded-DNA-specific exonuclease
MATGRGKSCIFHVHAARCALKHHKASVFVFPLRALISDQRFHLQESFGVLGLTAETINGETPHEERRILFDRLRAGKIDVVLTTPEFLSIHRDTFAATKRIGFLAVDEAHHVGLSKSYDRPAYKELGEVCRALSNPTVAAFTATANAPVAREIETILGTSVCVFDETMRENLQVSDERGVREKGSYLVTQLAQSPKSRAIAYVNSRAESVSLVRMLRKQLPDIAHRIAFYHGGLSREKRCAIEGAFRSGDVDVIVATSAFGEGVNIADIADIYLYHMPFGRVSFNQMSGRAGRNGNPATIHLLFGASDAQINEHILATRELPYDDGACYLEILHEREEFTRFCDWVISASACELRDTIISPIFPR